MESDAVCKYAALFDMSTIYDGLRYSFLSQLCKDSDLRTLPSLLLEDHSAIVEDFLHTEDFHSLVNVLTEVVPRYSKVLITTGPPAGFASMIWTCYLHAIRRSSYYFSISELLLSCYQKHSPVIIFKKHGAILSYQGSTLDRVRYAQGETVLVMLTVNENDHQGEDLRGYNSSLEA